MCVQHVQIKPTLEELPKLLFASVRNSSYPYNNFLACVSPCISCITATACINCVANYFYDSPNSACIPCVAGSYSSGGTVSVCTSKSQSF